MIGSEKLAKAMHFHVKEYLGSARRLREPMATDDGYSEDFPTVAIVADALAAEVALKALLVIQHDLVSPVALREHLVLLPNRHALTSLFYAIDQDIQSEVTRSAVSRMAGRVRVLSTGYPGEVVKMSVKSNQGFPDWLELHSRAFETWRYPYEKPYLWIAHSFGTALAEALEESLGRMLYPDGELTVFPRG